MSWFPDLGQEAMVASGDHVRAVGWLSPHHPFPMGDTPALFRARLQEFANLWAESTQELAWPVSGPHRCEFCNIFMSAGNFGVPGGDVLFVSPEMVSHYVEEHGYHPPGEFITAVLVAPLPGTGGYRAAVSKFQRLTLLPPGMQELT